jgi:hypothetical protein
MTMTPEQIVEGLKGMSRPDLRKTAELAARLLSQLAEDVYDQDPENNGMPAQEYADMAGAMETMALVGVEAEEETPDQMGEDLLSPPPRPNTLSEAVAQSRGSSVWSGD